jgi:hypothetical protein
MIRKKLPKKLSKKATDDKCHVFFKEEEEDDSDWEKLIHSSDEEEGEEEIKVTTIQCIVCFGPLGSGSGSISTRRICRILVTTVLDTVIFDPTVIQCFGSTGSTCFLASRIRIYLSEVWIWIRMLLSPAKIVRKASVPTVL